MSGTSETYLLQVEEDTLKVHRDAVAVLRTSHFGDVPLRRSQLVSLEYEEVRQFGPHPFWNPITSELLNDLSSEYETIPEYSCEALDPDLWEDLKDRLQGMWYPIRENGSFTGMKCRVVPLSSLKSDISEGA